MLLMYKHVGKIMHSFHWLALDMFPMQILCKCIESKLCKSRMQFIFQEFYLIISHAKGVFFWQQFTDYLYLTFSTGEIMHLLLNIGYLLFTVLITSQSLRLWF